MAMGWWHLNLGSGRMVSSQYFDRTILADRGQVTRSNLVGRAITSEKPLIVTRNRCRFLPNSRIQ
jgi:hypothetical protein